MAKLLGSQFYTNFGRVAHAYWGLLGTYVTDDYGNAIELDKNERDALRVFLRSGDEARSH